VTGYHFGREEEKFEETSLVGSREKFDDRGKNGEVIILCR